MKIIFEMVFCVASGVVGTALVKFQPDGPINANSTTWVALTALGGFILILVAYIKYLHTKIIEAQNKTIDIVDGAIKENSRSNFELAASIKTSNATADKQATFIDKIISKFMDTKIKD